MAMRRPKRCHSPPRRSIAASVEARQPAVEAAEYNLSQRAKPRFGFPRHRRHGDRRGPICRKPVDPGRDRRKGDRREGIPGGKPQRGGIARCEQPVLIVLAAAPDRPDRVDDVAGLEPVAPRYPRLARRAAAEGGALREELRAGGAVDGAVDPAPAEEDSNWRR